MVKPQLVIQDFGGVHSENGQATSARLMRGGSWKRQRIVVVIPAADTIPAKVCLAHWNLAFPPNNGVVRILALGMEVGEAYSHAIEQILADPNLSQWEYVLTLEHDNMGPPDGVLKLLERMEEHPELACIGGLYFTKGPAGVAQIWGDIRDPVVNFRPQIPVPGELIECYGTGMGFNLWRLSMFKDEKISRPWFKTTGSSTQDMHFWTNARKHGYRCGIDCAVRVGHLDLKGEFGEADMAW